MAQRHTSHHISNINKRKNRDATIIHLAAIVKYSGDAIIGKTLQGVITSWNNSAEKLFGYAADEVIGKSLSLIFPPDRQDELPQILARIKQGEIVQHLETTRIRKDGTYVEVSVTVSPIQDLDGRIIAASTIVHNINEQKRMIEELATRSRELEHPNEELATRSRELEHSNEELATRSRELEHSNEELATRSRELEHSNEELATRSRELEHSNEELATRSRELEHSNEELATRSRELERSNEDLSRQRDELATLNSDLEEANQARSQFLSTMSHELRTPLASIIGFSQMLLDDEDIVNLNPQQHNDLERILKNGQHLLSLINEVLDLTKIEAGRMVVTYSQVDVRELLTSVVEETQSIAIANHLVLRAEVDERVAFLESNPLKLRQVLLNLVSNALKFTEQGEVTVSARRVISSGKEADQIAIAVKDSGIGIPADVQEHIFEAFYQVDGSYTRKIGGTGLGLSIVSQLTTLLGGTIAVKSAPGQGSTFTVLLPVKALHQYIEQDSPSLHVAQPNVDP